MKNKKQKNLKQDKQKKETTIAVKKGKVVIEEYKLHDPLKRYKWYKFSTMKKWFQKTFSDDETMLINMELDNGHNISFLTKIKDGIFKFDGSTYIIDLNLKYYSSTSKIYCLDYHQSLSIPIRRKIDVAKIETAIKNNSDIECITATNPSNITRFMDSSIISKIFEGADLDKKIDMIKMLAFGSLIASSICVLGIAYIAYQMGMIPK